jgi:hypothetical protein
MTERNQNYDLLVDLMRQNIKQTNDLRDSFEAKLDGMSDRLNDRIDEVEKQSREYEMKFNQYDHWVNTIRGSITWLIGGGLAGLAALAASIAGVFNVNKPPH